MKINPKYLQLASEGLIPLLGYFLWDWSLYFILLFYFIDLIGDEVIVNLKSAQIVKAQNPKEGKKTWLINSAISLSLLVAIFVLIHITMPFIEAGIVFTDEITAFWTYEEMGIQQGYLLIPLVLLVSYQQYRMEFLMRAKYRNMPLRMLWNKHKQAFLLILGFTGLGLGLVQFIAIPEIIFVLLIVLFSAIYKLRFAD